MIDKTREIALKVLYKIENEDSYSNIALNEAIKENKDRLNKQDIGLISEIVYGVTSWRLTLDTIIKNKSNIKMKKISTWVINILRMGIYQMLFLDKIPQSAAVNESVNLAKRYGHQSSANFVNAILRNTTIEDYVKLFKIEDPIERISKTTSMPIWIIEHLLAERGYKKLNNEEVNKKAIEEVKKICESYILKPETTVRINHLKIDNQKFEEMLTGHNITFLNLNEEIKKEANIKTNYLNISKNNDFYILKKVKNIENLDLFKKGFFTVQDLSAGMAAFALEAKKDENILDACSAPGGKTTYIAEIMQNKGKIEAWDLHKSRINLIEENARRLGITIIKTKQNDATIYQKEYEEKFDKILLDVPCMGIGVLRRKPDIKWKRKPEELKEIIKIQKEILQNCSKYVKKGGTIIYSTCSIFEEENSKIVENFVKENLEFKAENIQILPNKYQDGFFISKIKKE